VKAGERKVKGFIAANLLILARSEGVKGKAPTLSYEQRNRAAIGAPNIKYLALLPSLFHSPIFSTS
jgi:hypothetical protein